MKKFVSCLCLLLVFALLLPCAGTSAEAYVYHYDADFSKESIGEVFTRYLTERRLGNGSIAMGWYDLESGEEWYFGGDTFMEGASTYKLPLSMVYADKIAAGELTEDGKVAHYVLRDALEVMLVNSNNAAGRVLCRELHVSQVEYRALLAQYCGLDESELPDRYYHSNAYSPRFLIGTLHTLYDNSEKYDLLLGFLKRARPAQYFSLYRGDIEVAHKYGSDVGYVCDSGIIYTERPFLLCVMTYGLGGAQIILGEIARIAMDYAEYLAAQEPEPTPTPEPTPVPLPTPLPTPAPDAESPAAAESAEEPEKTRRAPAEGTEAGQRVLLAPIAGAGLVLAGTLALLLRRRKE